MSYQHINKLEVLRKVSDGARVAVGLLAQNQQGIYFQYDTDYLVKFHNLSPFNLTFDSSLQLAPAMTHNGLHGAFSDSLPDGGIIMDRVFRQVDLLPQQVTAMARLSFVGDRAMEALSYLQIAGLQKKESEESISIAQLGLQAQACCFQRLP